MKTSKQRAIELVSDFKDFVNPYIGSGMLSNSYDNDAILMQSKSCAKVAVKHILRDCIKGLPECFFWVDVGKEINNVLASDIFPNT